MRYLLSESTIDTVVHLELASIGDKGLMKDILDYVMNSFLSKKI